MSDFLQRYQAEKAAVAEAMAQFVEDVHYRRNEEGKPTLMDAGAALLRDALGLYPDGHRVLDLRMEPGGHLRAVVAITLYERDGGRPRASGIGSASSRELLSPGRRLAGDLDPGNVACKLATKRAEVDAMLGIPAVCERFAQDVGLRPVVDPETGEVREEVVSMPAREVEAAPASSPAPTPPAEPAAGRAPSLPSRPHGLRPRPTPEEASAQRKAYRLAAEADRRNPYAYMARVLGIPVQGVSPVAAVLRWLDAGHSWQEIAERLEAEAKAPQG
jgi:hypothetical protein